MERRSTLCQLGFCKIYIWGECQWRFSRSRTWKSITIVENVSSSGKGFSHWF
jgi:hypothetical protein